MKQLLYCFTICILILAAPAAFAQQEPVKPKKSLWSFFKKNPQKVKKKGRIDGIGANTDDLGQAASRADSLDQLQSDYFVSSVDCDAYEGYVLSQAIRAKRCAPAVAPTAKSLCKELTTFRVEDSIAVDIKWLTAGPDYFNAWDSDALKIYGNDLCSFTDSIVIDLFCESKLSGWSMPTTTERVTSKYGFRWRRWHHGVDLDLEIGDPVFAPFDGIVRVTDYDRGFGRYIVLRHSNGLETVFGHLSRIQVTPGQLISAGQIIGLGGNTGRSTGSHLHFEIRYNGHALDPKVVFDFEARKIKDQMLVVKPSLYSRMIAFGIGCNHHHNRVHHPSPAALFGSQYHRVRPGESLWTISRKYGVSISQICKLSGISRRTVLRTGRRIRVN